MSKALILRWHRWLTLAFSVPLALLILTGLILSFEPVVRVSSIEPARLSTARVVELLERHDPAGKAQGLAWHPYENRLAIGGGRSGPPIHVDVATGNVMPRAGWLATTFDVSRFIHEHIVPGFGWLVQASTIAMLVLIALGIAMGWPRFANSVSGWHKTVAWGGLPLLILSPLTGILMAWGISFTGPASPPLPPVPMIDAVRHVGASHDLSNLVWLRNRGGRQLARVVSGGEYQIHVVSREGLTATPRNWVRTIHEGNFAGIWSGLMNVVISLAFAGLMTTGLILWARRKFRKRQPRVAAVAVGAAERA